ncbi:MAG: VanZ family protein [Acidobacteriia bacterium]|nr:VanZ family protein [Terriglobia bacterium]
MGRYGTVMSSGSFRMPESDEDPGWSIEIWMQPSRTRAERHFFSVFSPASTDLLSLRQYADGVVVSENKEEEYTPTHKSLYVDAVFRPATPVFLTIAASGRRTSVFVDGALRKSTEVLRFSKRALAGQFILGDSPLISDSWSGWIGGFAVYARELSPSEVSQHFASWSQRPPPTLTEDAHPAALYLFKEGAGNIIHNQVRSGVDLMIPERYLVAGKLFLERPWDEYEPAWSYYKSILINVAGFVPFGFLWYGYLSLSFPQQKTRTVWTTVILGTTMSLTMEILQGFLPTRSSGMTDIVTNTAGTTLGVVVYRLSEGVVHKILSRVHGVMDERQVPIAE